MEGRKEGRKFRARAEKVVLQLRWEWSHLQEYVQTKPEMHPKQFRLAIHPAVLRKMRAVSGYVMGTLEGLISDGGARPPRNTLLIRRGFLPIKFECLAMNDRQQPNKPQTTARTDAWP